MRPCIPISYDKPTATSHCCVLGQDTKHHPASVDLELIKRLVATTKAGNLQKFLTNDFSAISKDLAGVWPPTPAGRHPPDMQPFSC